MVRHIDPLLVAAVIKGRRALRPCRPVPSTLKQSKILVRQSLRPRPAHRPFFRRVGVQIFILADSAVAASKSRPRAPKQSPKVGVRPEEAVVGVPLRAKAAARKAPRPRSETGLQTGPIVESASLTVGKLLRDRQMEWRPGQLAPLLDHL